MTDDERAIRELIATWLARVPQAIPQPFSN